MATDSAKPKKPSAPRTRRPPAEISTTAELLRPSHTAVFIGIGITQLWKYRREDPTFPKPVRLGARAVAFSRSDLLRWIESRKQS